MSAWDTWVDVTAHLLPREHRETWAEQWRADLLYARELGISRFTLASSMLRLAVVGLPGHRATGTRLRLLVAASAMALVAAIIVPPLLLVYLVIGLLVLSFIGARRGVPTLGHAATGVVISVAGIVWTFAVLRVDGGFALRTLPALALFLFGEVIAVTAFGRVWAAHSQRPRPAWVSVIAAGAAAANAFAAAVAFSAGIAAANGVPPGGEAPPHVVAFGLLVLVAVPACLVAVATSVAAGLFSARDATLAL